MSLIFAAEKPKGVSFAESWDETAGAASSDVAADRLWDASRNLGLWRDGSNAEWLATAEAYERRIKAIHDATGVMLVNPTRQPENSVGPGGQRTVRTRQEVEAEFRQQLFEVAEAHPEHAGVIGLDRPIRADALAVTKQAEDEFNAAAAGAAGLSAGSRFGNMLGGALAAMARDPLQVSTLFVGAGPSGARTVIGRIAQTMLTEAAINGGVEAMVQASSQGWRREAGVESGLGPALQQVGLAAMFGGGFGGLVAGGSEVFRALGRTPPAGALERIAAGEADPTDLSDLAAALDRPLTGPETRLADIAAEQAALDRAAFGAPPDGLAPDEASGLAADALRAIEEPADALPAPRDGEEGYRQIERILREDQPLGPQPRQPQSLFDFLAEKGGIKDEGGAMKAMGLSRRFVPGRGPLVRKTGMSLDYAREAAAEAGFLDNIAGDADEAVAISTPDQLLQLIQREAGGDKVFSRQIDGALIDEAAEFQGRVAAREAYRRLLQEVDSAAEELALPRLDDRLMRRAAEISAETGDEPVDALERALDEDYRQFADALAEREEPLSDEFEIPFFEDARPAPRAGGEAAGGSGEAAAGGRGPAAQPGERLPDGGAAEGQGAAGRLKPAGNTPEPGTPQAAEQAAMALREAQTEIVDTMDGPREQGLIDGVAPVTTKEKLQSQAAKPMRGGTAAMPKGGLFDEDARQQIDLWDAMPAGRDDDGQALHATHADMVEEADRDGLFADIIKNCGI